MNIGVLITGWVIFMLILYKNDLKWVAEEIIKKFFKKKGTSRIFLSQRGRLSRVHVYKRNCGNDESSAIQC